VLAFCRDPHAGQYLRRTVLALQLLQNVQSICAKEHGNTEPLLVSLAKGRAGTAVTLDFFSIVSKLHLDAELDLGPAVALLVSVVMDVCLRFREYLLWPFAAYTLSKKHNPDGYVLACRHFLELPDEMLDTGFGLPLRRLVLQAGDGELMRVQYLMSESVQQALDLAFDSAAASSLPVERAFAACKRSEAPRLCHVATASRNQILRQFLRQRQETLQEVSKASAAVRRSMRTNVASLAWELQPQLSDHALRHSSAAMRQTML
jgi:hypothetical protein